MFFAAALHLYSVLQIFYPEETAAFLKSWLFFRPSQKFSFYEWTRIKLNSTPNIFLLVSLEHFLTDPEWTGPILIFNFLFFPPKALLSTFFYLYIPFGFFSLSHEPNISVLNFTVLTNTGLFWLVDVSVWIYQEGMVSSLLSPSDSSWSLSY